MKEYIMRYENEVLQLLPDKMQELVRCKDCKKRYDEGNDGCPYCNECGGRAFPPDDWFCADGKPKDGDGNA